MDLLSSYLPCSQSLLWVCSCKTLRVPGKFWGVFIPLFFLWSSLIDLFWSIYQSLVKDWNPVTGWAISIRWHCGLGTMHAFVWLYAFDHYHFKVTQERRQFIPIMSVSNIVKPTIHLVTFIVFFIYSNCSVTFHVKQPQTLISSPLQIKRGCAAKRRAFHPQ